LIFYEKQINLFDLRNLKIINKIQLNSTENIDGFFYPNSQKMLKYAILADQKIIFYNNSNEILQISNTYFYI